MAYRYLPAKFKGGKQTKINLIVIHGTVSPTRPGQALATAKYFQTLTRASSAHYTVDPEEIVQSVPDNIVAYHCGRNSNSLGIELCDPVAGSADRWNDEPHRKMLRLATGLVKELCDKHGVPFRKLTPAQVRAGERGICGHVDIRDAFPGSTTHYDPGPGFPWSVLLSNQPTLNDEENELNAEEKKQLKELREMIGPIHRMATLVLPLTGRPGKEADDMYGHVLNNDAMLRTVLKRLDAIEARLGK